jgi:hypothetical protein
MSLPLYPALVQLQASGANVRGFTFPTSLKSFRLQQLVLDHSVFAQPPGSTPLWDALITLFRYTQALQYLSCNNCSLQVRSPPLLSSNDPHVRTRTRCAAEIVRFLIFSFLSLSCCRMSA